MQNRNKLSTKFPTEERRTVGKMNGTAITNRLQNSFKIKDNNVYDHRIIEISLKDLHLTS
jgi:hypothetical protein